MKFYDEYGFPLKPYDIVLYRFKGSGKIPWKGIILIDFNGELIISNLADPDDYQRLDEVSEVIFVGELVWLSEKLDIEKRILSEFKILQIFKKNLKEVNDEKNRNNV